MRTNSVPLDPGLHPCPSAADGTRITTPAPGFLREPVSRVFGFDRGRCLDRYYIEQFLHRYRGDVQGRVLEVAEDRYTRAYGGERVVQSDILHVDADFRRATIVADLTQSGSLPSATFDCIILTQTLQHLFDLRAAVKNIHNALRPGGTVLVSVPGISQISRFDMDRWGDYWRFTTLSLRTLLNLEFDAAEVHVESSGNVQVAAAFLYGYAFDELDAATLDRVDPDYQVLVVARAVRRK